MYFLQHWVLPRRYAFRYLEIETIDTSMKWQLVVEDVVCRSVSSVSLDDVKPVETEDEMVKKLDRVSLRTLKNCMQDVLRMDLSETAVCGLEI